MTGAPTTGTERPSPRLAAALARQRRRRQAGQIALTIMGMGAGYALSLLIGDWLMSTVIGGAIGLGVSQRKGVAVPGLIEWTLSNGLKRAPQTLEPVTPLLLQPWGRSDGYVRVSGHGSGFEGKLAAFNFVRPVRFYAWGLLKVASRGYWPDAKGVQALVAVSDLAGSEDVVPVLLCERRYGGKLLDSVEDAAADLERVELESIALDSRYELFTERGADGVWIRRLLSPSLVVWLSEHIDDALAFEVFDGSLCIARQVESLSGLQPPEIAEFVNLAAELDARIRTELGQTQLGRDSA